MKRLLFAAAVLSRLTTCQMEPSFAHPPNAPFASWFNTLHQPDNPVASCCGVADAYEVDEYYPDETVQGGFTVRLGALQIKVPPDKVIWTEANPTGRGQIFLAPNQGAHGPYVYCFVPAAGS
jgi:hypothetical protein